MPSSKIIANRIKTINNEMDKAKHEKNQKLKEDIKDKKKGVDLEKNKNSLMK